MQFVLHAVRRALRSVRPRPSRVDTCWQAEKRHRGFTLVELLVVIAVIGILVALLLPAVQAAREAARRMSCGNNLKQLGLALQNYHDSYRRFPPESIWAHGTRGNWQPRNYSWIALTLPFLEQGTLHDQMDFRLPLWDQPTSSGQTVQSQIVPPLLCPSDVRLGSDASAYHGMSWTNYAGTEGFDWWNNRDNPLGGLFTFQSSLRLSDVHDGTSNTIALGEVTSTGFKNGPFQTSGTGIPRVGAAEATFRPALVSPPWTDSQGSLNTVTGGYPSPDGVFNPQPSFLFWRSAPALYKPTYVSAWGINSDWPGPASYHPGGAQFVMIDGSVHFLPETIEISSALAHDQKGVWSYLNTVNGSEVVAIP